MTGNVKVTMKKKDGNLCLGRLHDSDCGGALSLPDGSGAGQRLH